jgi:hypothetical protein
MNDECETVDSSFSVHDLSLISRSFARCRDVCLVARRTAAKLSSCAATALEGFFVRAVTGSAALRQDAFDFRMRSGNNMNRNQLAYATSRRRARIRCRFDRADIAANENRDISRADIFFAEELNISGFDHCVCCFDSADKTFGFYHSECFECHISVESSLFLFSSETLKEYDFRSSLERTTARLKVQESAMRKS